MIAIPLWQFFLLLGGSGVTLVWFLLYPSVRWVLRRRVNRLIHQLNDSLDFKLPPFKLSKRQALINALIVDPQILAAAKAWAEQEGLPLEVARKRVLAYSSEIVPSFNAYFYFKLGSWLSRKLSQAIYRIRLGKIEEQALAQIPEQATIVFVLNHRSNMDYILVSHFASSRTAISYAVGEWARIWPLQGLIRSLGAYFVRRQSDDPLYRKVLEKYVQMATQGGVTQAIFLEGKLTRDGHLNPPKLGLLDYMLRDYNPGQQRDIVFLPVGINYDRVLEDRSLQLARGKSPKMVKKVRITAGFLTKIVVRRFFGQWFRFGYASVNFGAPFSLQKHLASQQIELRDMDKDTRMQKVQHLAEQLMERVQNIIPVLPVSLVACAFVQAGEATLSLLELKVKIHRTMQDFESQGVHIYLPRGDMDYAIEVGLRMLTLRHFVTEDQGLYQRVEAERPLLEYYANSIAHYHSPAESLI